MTAGASVAGPVRARIAGMRWLGAVVFVAGCAQILGIDDPGGGNPPDDAAGPMDDAPTKGDAGGPQMGSRFWKVIFDKHDESGGGTGVVLTELQFRFDGAVHGAPPDGLSTPSSDVVIEAVPTLQVLEDGNFDTKMGTSFVSAKDGAEIDIDFGVPHDVRGFVVVLSGNGPAVEWTPTNFRFCSTTAQSTSMDCTMLLGGARDQWQDSKPREFAIP